jgi:undecaprenyl-phosphate 4-deoxy-4-formamido-L-arabinose transferase
MAGTALALLSLAGVVGLAIRRLVVGPEAEGVFTLFGIAFFLIGVLLIGLGVVGEYVGRIYEQVRQRPRYMVAAILEEGAQADDSTQKLRQPQADSHLRSSHSVGEV